MLALYPTPSPTSSRYSQVPSDSPFDLSSVPLEEKAAPGAAKPGAGKKAAKEAAGARGGPAAGAAAATDLYEKTLNAIPELASFGKLFKVREAALASDPEVR